ncbi:MAG: peptide-methionine (S)-S-oxide reductase, partial [Allomuricauda sp.]
NQKKEAEEFIALLEKEKVFTNPIVTAVSEAKPFYIAEQEHQNYYNDHSNQPYCQFIIDPKIKKLSKHFSNKLNTAT